MSLQPLSEKYESDYGDELWFGGSGCGLLTVGEWSAGGCKSHNPEDWEDLKKQANLIAAAPDLLEALESALTILTDSVGDFDYDKSLAAIARAKGEA